MATLWQQVLAQDARYNAYRVPDNPQHRALYMRRRSHLLRENAALPARDIGARREYLKLRGQLLAERYGPANSISEQGSVRSKAPSISSQRHPRSKGSDYARFKKPLGQQPVTGMESSPLRSIAPTASAEASRAMAGGKTAGENYAFSGMHHIFDQHKSAVVSVKFANDDKSRVACCSYDGTISVMQLIPPPATVICTLCGHTSAVTDFAWSLSNDVILSSSLDGTTRLWEVASTKCIRSYGSSRGPEVLCCTFQPQNNNIFAIGKGNGDVQILNVSTGKSIKGGSVKVAGRVLSLTYDASGHHLWTADDKGYIFAYNCDTVTGKVSSKFKKISVCPGYPITSICSRTWISREARDPSVLANCGMGAVVLFRVTGSDGNLQVRRKFAIQQRGQLIRSTFCPLMSFRQGACIVSGSEDMTVQIFDIEREKKPCVNTLQGHSAPVLDVCFNYDESLLASCDANGVVIIWKRSGIS